MSRILLILDLDETLVYGAEAPLDLSRVLMIDDDPRALRRNYGNLIRISPYLGEADDAELGAARRYLKSLLETADVRQIEKRAWRQRIAPE